MKFILFTLLFFPLLTIGQDNTKPKLSILPEVDGNAEYTEIVKVDTALSKMELYNRAKLWFVDNYNSAKNVLQMDDKESGIIVGKGIMPLSFPIKIKSTSATDSVNIDASLNLNHTIKIYLKKGRYKYEINELSETLILKGAEPMKIPIANYGYKPAVNVQTNLLRAVDNGIKQTIISLKSAMNKPVSNNSNW